VGLLKKSKIVIAVDHPFLVLNTSTFIHKQIGNVRYLLCPVIEMPKMCANRSLTSSVLHLKGGTLIISFTRRVFYMVKRFISITMLQMKAMKMIEKNNCCDEGDCL
jgi:hypothetical protein